MKRTNIFKLNPGKEEKAILHEWADNCSRMYNEINYKRRQSFFSGEFDWSTDEFYRKYKKLIGSATAQQIIIKNNEAWKSFFALLKAYKAGKIEDRPHSPGYWKDRNTGRRILRILVRSDAYKLDNKYLRLPFRLRVKWRGKNKWRGKQGRLEIVYDALSGRWVCYMPVEAVPPHQPTGQKRAYLDLGVKCPIVADVDGEVFGYRGNSLLADWWYWTHEIAKYQEILNKNGKKTSKKLRKLYRKRQRRFRDAINKIVKDLVEKCWRKGVSEIICGDLVGIRKEADFGRKGNAMIHNYWSHGYILRRIREKAEEYGIKVKAIDERGTSSVCPRCFSAVVTKRGRLFKCRTCGLEAHRDAIGAQNIRLVHEGRGGVDNRVVAHPLLLSPAEIGAGTSAL
ncbi:MAG: Transposase [Candidatus Alkanophagales archaeon MCA70_species_2]|nr:Transposase [Candidatus Alkanophaga liquidiphilum]